MLRDGCGIFGSHHGGMFAAIQQAIKKGETASAIVFAWVMIG
jgi:hypothetical protein